MNNNDFKVYVIYKDGEILTNNKKVCCYIFKDMAELFIKSESKHDGRLMYNKYCKENNINNSWHDLCKEEKEKWYNEGKKIYKIKTFSDINVTFYGK